MVLYGVFELMKECGQRTSRAALLFPFKRAGWTGSLTEAFHASLSKAVAKCDTAIAVSTPQCLTSMISTEFEIVVIF